MFDVITIGTATRDVFLRSPLFTNIKDPKHFKKMGIISGEATCFALGSKIGIEEPVAEIGGAAVNAAITFSKQGFKTAALFKIGDDETGKSIIQKLKTEKIANLGVVDKKIKTAYSAILLSPDGERTILTYRGASEAIKEKEIPFHKLKSKWAYISPSQMNFNLVKKIIDRFHKQKTFIALNPSSLMIKIGVKKLFPVLKKIKVLILNREEASYLTGINYDKKERIFRKLNEAVGGIFLMTDGKNGAWVSDNKNLYQATAFKPSKAIDETGSGDAFGSGFVAGLMRKNEECRKNLCNRGNIEYAVRLASANAASNIEQIGAQTGILTRKEFKQNRKWKKLPIKITKIM